MVKKVKLPTHFFRFYLLRTIVVFAIILSLFVSSIAYNYDISVNEVVNACVRKTILTAISGLTLIYDPTPVEENVIFSPKKKEYLSENYISIEKYFDRNDTKKIKLISENNQKNIIDNMKFSYQYFDEERLQKLRKIFKLDLIVKTAETEFAQMILLRNWARSQFRRNDFQSGMNNFDALEILNRNYRNENNSPRQPGFYTPCNFFPMLYTQVMLSMGYQVRLCQLSEIGYNGHGVTEVWSNQFNKWIEMDADLNLHYEKDGIPLNMIEIHNEVEAGREIGIKIIRGVQTSGDGESEKDIGIYGMFEYHKYCKILDMRNDWMTNYYFKGHPKRGDMASLTWFDKRYPSVFTLTPTTSNIDEFYWSINRTEILCSKYEGKYIQLFFQTYTPNFKCFRIIIDNSTETVIDTEEYSWALHSGKNILSVKAENQHDIKGVPSSVEIWVD